ncbi:protein SIEVE ELEMENT OCCLUSION B-like isoform X2 [Ipomoea triloba]|uniref:protein SIEVE ELEMENT OCCLUSION B-like isoform X2 n=1 Tax=Ipomoea triloba TaxID=35885 RepID=UPI00125DAB71|nr:protein SIEVE ELEMENT OCCLUSION B-like isoform X2 [Ipomoea triloba]
MSNQVLSLSTSMISQNHAIDIEEAIIVEHVKATHDPRGEMDVDASSILNFVDDIFNSGSNTILQEATQDKLMLKEYIQNEMPSHVLQLSLKVVACSCLNNTDSHSIAICLLSALSVYPWHTKVVMMLASFAIIYGKLVLSEQMSCSNRKNLKDTSIKSVLDLVKLMVELKHSSPMIVANYWIARFVVAYTRLCILDPESQIELTDEQSMLSTKIKEIMTSGHSLLEAKRREENYQALLHAFNNSSDVLEVLKLIFDIKNDEDKVILYLHWVFYEFLFYNYTSEREQALWDKESWNLKLVASKISYQLNNRIDNEECIFLCGGNDNKQVQEFTLKIQEVCSKTQMNMKITYIGRSEKVKVEMQRVGCLVFSSSGIKEFWRRIQSMALSRIQYLIAMGLGEGNDEIMQGLKKLLAYEAEGSTVGAWALLSKGNRIIACDIGDKMLGVMNEYEKWKDNAQAKGFEHAFRDCYEMLSYSSHTPYQHPCCSLNYPSNCDKILDTESCPQCNHNMHKLVTFSCCHTFEEY